MWVEEKPSQDVQEVVVVPAMFRPSRNCRPTSVPARFFNPILPYGRHLATIIGGHPPSELSQSTALIIDRLQESHLVQPEYWARDL